MLEIWFITLLNNFPMKPLFSNPSILVIVLLLMAGCSVFKSKKTVESAIPHELQDFLSDFEKAVKSQNNKKILSMMDKEYLTEQHDIFLKGNTSQFLNEFFCGELTNGRGFKCLKFNELKNASKINIIKDLDYYVVMYEISDSEDSIITSWTISVREIKGKIVYGLVGAMG